MKQSVKYLFAINSSWMSFDSVSSFKPFLTTLIVKEKLEKAFDQQLSDFFYKEYGFKLPYFILTNIVSSYISGGFAENDSGFLYFDLKKIESLPRISDNDFQIFNVNYDTLVKDFIIYCDSKDIDKSKAEKIILSFIKTYDAEMLSDKLDYDENTEIDIEKSFFYLYLKEVKEIKSPNYDFILKMCEGNLIKTFLFNEGIENVKINDMKIIIDSPVIFRILGFYDEYYKNEYRYLIDLLKNNGSTLHIFRHNFDEVINLLNRCIIALEDLHFDYSKAPQIAMYFRQKGLTTIDITQMISTLEDDLHEIGISILDNIYDDFDERYIESQVSIEEILKNTYFSTNKYSPEKQTDPKLLSMIDNDVKSVMYSYAIRAKNNIKTFKDCNLFFVTNNSGLISTILEYNKKYYPDTIAPVIRDTLIGMIACSNDLSKIQKLVEQKIISYAYSAHKPTKRILESFTHQIESMKSENLITDEQYIILKHNKAVIPNLLYLANDEYVNYSTIQEVLVKVEETIVKPYLNGYIKKIDDLIITNTAIDEQNKELSNQINENKFIINEVTNELEKKSLAMDKMKNKIDKMKQFEKEQYTKRIYLIWLIGSIFVLVSTIGVNLLSFIISSQVKLLNFLLIVVSVLIFVYDLFAIWINYSNKEIKSINKLLKRKYAKLDKKYKE